MRHTRSRQVEKVNPFMKGTRNVPIWYMREHTAEIDKTFKWRRKALSDGRNTVFFQKNGSLRVIKVKTQ